MARMATDIQRSLDQRCYNLIQLYKKHTFVSFDLVLSSLLQECQAPSLESLGVRSLPCLDYLWIMNEKVIAYISSYVSIHSIVCLQDMEEGLVHLLTSYHFRPLTSPNDDPNEIRLDEEEQPFSARQSFADFQIGELAWHSSIQRIFPSPLSSPLLSYETILQDLLIHVEEDAKSSLPNRESTFQITNFISFLQRKYCYETFPSLVCFGVWMRGDLQQEVLMARQITSRRTKALLSMQGRTELRWAEEERGAKSAIGTLESKKRRRVETSDSAFPRLEPSSPAMQTFLESCRTALSNSPYSCTYKKLYAAIRDSVFPSQTDGLALDIATEYGLLALGSTKHRMKQFASISILDEENENVVVSDEGLYGKEEQELEETFADGGSQAASSSNSIQTIPPPQTYPVYSPMPDGIKMQLGSDSSLSFPVGEELSLAGLRSILPLSLPDLSICDNRVIGRWGEALVYHYLLATSCAATVNWVNEKAETQASYDLVLTRKETHRTVTDFVEVKSTRFDDRNVFSLSFTELEFMMNHPRPNYHIYRVYNAGLREKARIVVIRNVFELLQSKRVGLCLAI